MKNEVVVKILNSETAEGLKEMIEGYLNQGFTIQNSQVQWYCGTIEGVYVFVKTWSEGRPY